MSDLQEVRYEPRHLPALRDLWSQVYEPDSVPRRERAFRWITERNPASPGGAPRYLVMDGDRVAGTLGCLPVPFRLSKQRFLIHFSHDLLVDPSYRGLGLGKRLVRAVAGGAPSLAGGLWMTDPCYALHQRAGWTPVEPFYGQSLILNPRGALERRLGSALAARLLAPAARAFLGLSRRRAEAPFLTAVEVDRFDCSVDTLFDRVSPVLGLVAERRHSYLNWKYVESPHLSYRRIVIPRGKDLAAYAVCRLHRKDHGHVSGLIVDLLADGSVPGAFESAVLACVERLTEGGADIVHVLTTHCPFRRRLEQMGFRRGANLYTFVITGPLDQVSTERPAVSGSWYLTMGDSDGDMWAEAQSWMLARDAKKPSASVRP